MKLTVREAAAVLEVAETQIYRWVEHEDIPFVMIHQRPRFHRLELFEWAIDRELPIRGDLYEGDRDQPFTRALERGGPPVVIRDPSELAPEIPVDAEVIGAILLARAGALLVAHPALGVAIPRARSPIICPEVSATVMLRWCEPALAIGAASVGAMFLILAPTIKQHLELLSRLAVAIHDRELSAAVQARRPGDQLIADVRRWELAVEGAAR